MEAPSRSAPHLVLAGAFALGVAILFGIQFWIAQRSADRRVGIVVDGQHGLVLSDVDPEGPAARGGLRPGDVLVEIGGTPLHELTDYDVAAKAFERGQPVVYRVRRGDHQLDLTVVPGGSLDWLRLAVNGFVVFACLSIGLLTLLQRPGVQRVRPLWLFLFLLAIELALPGSAIGSPLVDVVLSASFFILTGAQMGAQLHLASVIPTPQRWLVRNPWLIVVYYTVGLAPGVAGLAAFLAELQGRDDLFPWTSDQMTRLLNDIGLPVWAVTVLVLLAVPMFRAPETRGRLQAGLVWVGVLPWAVYVAFITIQTVRGGTTPLWLDTFFPLIVLGMPVSVFVAIYRYHLFNLEVVVRRGLLYSVLTTTLLLVFYAALGAGSALFTKLVGEKEQPIWVVAGITLVLGLLIAPLRRGLHDQIDRWLFPERHALRQKMITLASELPARGRIQEMGRHLVDRMCEIFTVGRATLMVADPVSGLLLTVASGPAGGSTDLSVSFLLSPDDPGIVLVRARARPVPASELVAASPVLRQRFALLEAELVVPLLNHEKLVGLLVLGQPTTHRRFTGEEIELLDFLARHVSVVFENVRLFQSATYEGLTGLRRREAIQELLDREVDRARRYERPLSIGFADLDHFKKVNDRYGHLAGDTVLRRVSEEVRACLRSTDAVGRYGGEEFLLVFPETALDQAAIVTEKIRSRVEALDIPMDDGGTVRITISIGLASLTDLDENEPWTSRALIASADEALYRAKQQGRNRIEPAFALEASG